MKTPPLPAAVLVALTLLGARPLVAQSCAANDPADTDVTARFVDPSLFNDATDGGLRFSVGLALDPALAFDLGGVSLFLDYDNAALDFESLTFSGFVTSNPCYLPLGNNGDTGRTTMGVVISPACNPTGGTAGSALTPGAGPVLLATVVYAVRDAGAEASFRFTNAVSNDDLGQRCQTASAPLDSQQLPVEITRFDGRLDGSVAVLAWTTASETNNAGFHIEHRGEASSAWADAGWVAGAGTTAEARSYGYRVPGLAPGAHRFRLRQVDFDGASTFGPELELHLIPGGTPMLRAAPNPAASAAVLVVSLPRGGNARVSVYDLLGREVARPVAGRLDAGSHRIALDAAALPAGMYLCRLVAPGGTAQGVLTITR